MPRIPIWVFLLLAVLHFSAVRVDIMDIDASQYAEISREMAQTGDYLHIYDRGRNYLDKPPFLFWASSASIKVFGATPLGYKLPSILLALLAIYSTYRLARLLYDEDTGRVAALILGCCQGMFLMTNDVRCDLALMSWVIFAIWHLQEWLRSGKWYWLAGAGIGIGLGLLSKGPIALLAPAFSFGSDWVLKRKWRLFAKPQYLLMLALTAVLLIPFSIGLYQQFDLHPDKFIDGKSGVSGLRFFYWTQSFGRITGESSWDNGADISFQLLNMLWSFLPWIFLFLPALFVAIRQLIRQKFRLREDQEGLSLGGFLLCYLAVSMSHYQLPHYIFVAFPLAAILCASLVRDLYQHQLYPRLRKTMENLFLVVGPLLFTGVLLILLIVFPAPWYWFLVWAICVGSWIWVCLKKKPAGRLVWAAAVAAILVNVTLTHYFYYNLMQYQCGMVTGKYLRAQQIPNEKVMTYRMHDPLNALHFYANEVIRVFEKGYIPAAAGDYILTEAEGLAELQQRGYELQTVLSDRRFKVSELTGTFLNAAARDQVTTPYYLCKVIRKGDQLEQAQ